MTSPRVRDDETELKNSQWAQKVFRSIAETIAELVTPKGCCDWCSRLAGHDRKEGTNGSSALRKRCSEGKTIVD